MSLPPDDAAVITAPRPIAPLSTSRVTTRTPRLRWSLSAEATGARVELCRDRACTEILAGFDATGDTARSPATLPSGVVYWRLRGLRGTSVGDATGPTWQFTVPPRDATTDASWGSDLDLDGDGLAETAVGDPGGESGRGQVSIVRGRVATTVQTAADYTLTGETTTSALGGLVASAGDLDGDGYGDLAVGASDGVRIYLGGAGGLRTVGPIVLTMPAGDREFGGLIGSAGDVNADGYCDLFVGAARGSAGNDIIHLYFGGPDGPHLHPDTSVTPPAGMSSFGVYASAADIDADGHSDLVAMVPGTDTRNGSRGANAVLVYRGRPTVPLRSPSSSLSFPGGDAPGVDGFALGDVDGDGHPDLAVIDMQSRSDHEGNAVTLYPGLPSGEFQSTATWNDWFDAEDGVSPGIFLGRFLQQQIVLRDLDGDGHTDLVLAGYAQRLEIVPGGPTGLRSEAHVTAPLPVPAELLDWNGALGPVIAIPGDVDGDGIGDIAVGLGGARFAGRGMTLESPGNAWVLAGGAQGLAALQVRTSLVGERNAVDTFAHEIE